MRPHSLLKVAKHFHRDESGGVLIIVGLAIAVLVTLAGASIDFGRQQLLRQQMQQASDAAALAAANLPAGTPESKRTEVAQRYYKLNFPSKKLDGSDIPAMTVLSTSPTIQLQTAETEISTNFISNVDSRSLSRVKASSFTEVSGASTASSRKILLLLNNSASMGSKDADRCNYADYWQPNNDNQQQQENVGCATDVARLSSLKNAATSFTTSMMRDASTQIGLMTYNYVAPAHSSAQAPLGSTQGTVLAAINNMNNYDAADKGYTAFEKVESTPGYIPEMQEGDVKAVIFLDDSIKWESGNLNGPDDTRLRQLCDDFKNRKNIVIYTIHTGRAESYGYSECYNYMDGTCYGYNRHNRAEARIALMSECASGDSGPSGTLDANGKIIYRNQDKYFFSAPDMPAMQRAFDAIQASIDNLSTASPSKNLRITK